MYKFVVSDAVFIETLAVQPNLIDEKHALLCTIRFNHKFFFPIPLGIETNHHLIENGSGEGIFRQSGTIGIEAHHAENSPRRHCARIVVAGNSVGLGGEIFIQQALRFFLRTPLLSFEIREQVRVSNIGFVGGVVQTFVKNHLQLVDECPLPSHEFSQSVHVMRNVIGIIPRVSFVESGTRLEVFSLLGVERRIESTVGQKRTQRSELFAVIVAVAQRTFVKHFGIFLLAQSAGKARKGKVGYVVFQRMRNRVVVLRAKRHVPFRKIIVVVGTHQVLCSRRGGRFIHGFVCQFDVKVAQSFHPCIHNDRNARVALHRKRLPSVKFPFRQPAMLAIHVEHRAYHFDLPLGINQRQQLMYVPVRVPKRIHRVSVAFRCQNFIAFHCRIPAVDILQNIRMNEQVVKCRVEYGLLRLAPAFYGNTRQIIVPCTAGFRTYPVEVLVFLFDIQIQPGILHADERNTHADFYLLPFFRIKRKVSADVIAGNFFPVTRIKFILAVIRVPLRFHACHQALLLPIARGERFFIHPHHEVDRKHRLRIITESAQQLHPFYFAIVHPAQHGSAFVCQSFSQIQQDITLAFGECEASDPAARSGRNLSLYVIFGQIIGVVSRSGPLVFIFTSVFFIIDIQFSGSRHKQQRS